MALNSTDFPTLYPWICNAFFERILSQCNRNHQQSISVSGYTLNAALEKGENYASQMIRANVQFTELNSSSSTTLSHSFIIKATHPNADSQTVEKMQFRKEITAYLQVIPAVEKLLQSIGENLKLTARCYEANLELLYLVFEDLSVHGWSNVNRRTGLDMVHFKSVLSLTAKWHAATALYLSEVYKLYSTFLILKKINILVYNAFVWSLSSLRNNKIHFFQNQITVLPDYFHSEVESDTMRSIYITTIHALADAVLKLPGFEHLSDKLKNIDVYERILAATKTNFKDFNVLTHGDLWSNNFMFRHNGRLVSDVIMVDFQTLYIGSPALDLVYALYSSSASTVRAKDWDELVEYYWHILKDTLKRLGKEDICPGLSQLQEDRKKRTHHSLSIGLFSLATRNMENITDEEVDKLFGDAEENHQQRIRILMEPKVRSSLEYLLQFYDENGFFD